MQKLASVLITIAVMISVPAHAKGWFANVCERFLGPSARSFKSSPRLEEIRSLFTTQIHFINRFSSHPMEAQIERLKNVEGEPVSLVIRPKLSDAYRWDREPTIEAIVNPVALHLNWEDTGTDLREQPAFVLLFDDVEVSDQKGVRRVSDLVQEEIGYVRDRNPGLVFDIKIQPACEFRKLTFKKSSCSKSVFWVEGELSNFQVKRVMMAALEHAFEILVHDLAYCRQVGPHDQ